MRFPHHAPPQSIRYIAHNENRCYWKRKKKNARSIKITHTTRVRVLRTAALPFGKQNRSRRQKQKRKKKLLYLRRENAVLRGRAYLK